MTQICPQLQLAVIKAMVFVACRVAELDPFVTCIGFLSVTGIGDLDHFEMHIVSMLAIIFPETG